MPEMQGLYWGANTAEIISADVKQNQKGNTYAVVKMNAWGVSGIQLDVSPAEVDKFKPFLGKMVSISGNMSYEVATYDGKQIIRFAVSEIKPLGK
ncbi:hypothetical protein P4E94_19665 [Pontiellaceae bacterium B12219]|nr:hypothetical protein [Pontiellaceae bacterium B12219]